ncbi:DUF3604 domain-containing protein [Biformimicrobium ophioploci]|uniref:DUF3604 domain-containing protein n=1 Tax=Biformimicrobium ophioploci TaxID=3036711 RepID=A0ABQ6LXM0_9GAMM|nr:DUF3604 domain-containing protein [Microbulbifer sp. NKW57]GMG86772.1 DUF3604 domain-containing protein [Microbulbifer sp. NKW57]
MSFSKFRPLAFAVTLSLTPLVIGEEKSAKTYPHREAFFGNFHIHTDYSFDAFTNGAITNPDHAYRWAKGESIPGGGGGPELTIKKPLDWYMVSDHAEYLGVFREMSNEDSPLSKLDIAKKVTSDDQAVAFAAFAQILTDMSEGRSDPQLADPKISKPIWAKVVEIANAHNQPGKFTTFIGYEWTSNPQKNNLHRVVIFKDKTGVPDLPFSALDSDKPEDLWAWMEKIRAGGATLLAIPHNANASEGLMFQDTDSRGQPVSAEYSATRIRNEPLYEVSQIKGTSETHPKLSPNDEFANFELWEYNLSADATPAKVQVGSYMREAYRRGIAFEAAGKGNPFKYGLIGDSDSHNSAASIEEDNYTGKFAMENSAEHRLNGPPGFKEANKQQLRLFGSGGVAGVWAKSNTREEIYAALERKETFATSGTRMKVRFFGGYDFKKDMLKGDWLSTAYETGVPMGSDLPPSVNGKAPSFVIQAMKEAEGANLDRIQVIKGWVDGDKTHEKIFDVALSDARKVGKDGKVPSVGNTVDPKTATYRNDIGDTQLSTVWTDPEFKPGQHAFYYVRVLEIPTPRWSTYDAVSLGIPPRKDLPVSIQERAWTSPIWYTPEK